MDANIVLAGGGAKGAVLGGCLKAAEDKGIVPRGFGGTSAGSIVAALASVGYSGAELKEVLVKTDLASLLDDGGTRLEELKSTAGLLIDRLRNKSCLTLSSLKSLAKFFNDSYGIYQGDKLREFLAVLLGKKLTTYGGDISQITFSELSELGCRPLRIVATDLNHKRAVIFGTDRKGADRPVIDCVVASASFPFVFIPGAVDDMLLTDGGLRACATISYRNTCYRLGEIV